MQENPSETGQGIFNELKTVADQKLGPSGVVDFQNTPLEVVAWWTYFLELVSSPVVVPRRKRIPPLSEFRPADGGPPSLKNDSRGRAQQQ
ncbi:hypothetical protein ZHAS_00008197 [Anopheles sinensis]|uniref:Uncharacterized protein n=1 Tax=Anopheles sinensis TaxID=74873 RepID=A0A084VS24_ANOSI|nr:hypothetical protein ZHAS_00008197 [Anopheles sinensis]